MTTTDPTPATCTRCDTSPAVGLCCSTHKRALCHLCYRRTHWVEVCVKGCSECAAEGLPVRVRLADLPAVTDHSPAPTPIAPIDLDTIRRREQAATDGPWTLRDGFGPTRDGLHRFARIANAADVTVLEEPYTGRDVAATKANAEFIACARQDVADLLAEVDRLRARLASDQRWNNAVDWLLNSRHCGGDPDIQGPFWAYVDGLITRDELDTFGHDQVAQRQIERGLDPETGLPMTKTVSLPGVS